MVGRQRKSRSGEGLAGSHQRCWTWGRNAVLETLRAGRWAALEVIISDRLDAETEAEVRALTDAGRIRLTVAPFEMLTSRCRSAEHQGLVAKMAEYPYAEFSDVVAATAPPDRTPFLMVLDGVQDPFNFGAILRSAEIFGATGVIVGRRKQANVTPHVARSSSGAINHLPIARVDELLDAIRDLQTRGFVVIGADGHSTLELPQQDLRSPVAVVIGNEGSGIDPKLSAACDALVRIPQIGRTESLNVAVAAGIFCYEVQRQRSGALASSTEV